MTALYRALETDLALSERQVWRHYRATLEDCRYSGLSVQAALIAPTVHRKATRRVNFVLLEPTDFEGFELRHLAAVAETRQQLRADPRDWQVVQHAAITSPDAIWRRGVDTWAIEFDAGAYSRATLLEKARAFRAGFDGQVWAVSSDGRSQTLAQLFGVAPVIVRPF